MAIKINWKDLQKRIINWIEVEKVMCNWVQIRPENNEKYLCFEGNVGETESVSLVLKNATLSEEIFEYSYDKSNWTDYQYGASLDVSNWAKVYIRNKADHIYYIQPTANAHFQFSVVSTLWLKVSWDVTSLLCKSGSTVIPYDYCFISLFSNCNIVTAPELPATTLTRGCYSLMFYRTNITTAPALPATTMADDCYLVMFGDCSSLTTPPSLPATTLAEYCYGSMFVWCSSLTTAPALPAMNMVKGCYEDMFHGCSNLRTPPQLPATTMANSCYNSMFYNSGITSLPALPATTLAEYCYFDMFGWCAWIKVSETQTWEYQTPYRIPTTWTSTWATANSLKKMFEYTWGTFTGTPTTETTYYTSNTVI